MAEAPFTPPVAPTPPAPAAPSVPAPHQPQAARGWLNLPQMLFPNEYCWFVLFSSMDIMLTWLILEMGGSEINPIAAYVIERWQLPGAIVFKFTLTILVVLVCEIVGRSTEGRPRTARSLIQAAIIVSCLPVVYSLGLISLHVLHM